MKERNKKHIIAKRRQKKAESKMEKKSNYFSNYNKCKWTNCIILKSDYTLFIRNTTKT